MAKILRNDFFLSKVGLRFVYINCQKNNESSAVLKRESPLYFFKGQRF